MDEVTWTVTEASGEVKTVGKVKQMTHYPAFESNAKTTPDMKITIDRWNEMRQCLLENGLMKSK